MEAQTGTLQTYFSTLATALRQKATSAGEQAIEIQLNFTRGSYGHSVSIPGSTGRFTMDPSDQEQIGSLVESLWEALEPTFGHRSAAGRLRLTGSDLSSVQAWLIPGSRHLELDLHGVQGLIFDPMADPAIFTKRPNDHQRPISTSMDADIVDELVQKLAGDNTNDAQTIEQTVAELARIESELGKPLPKDLRALYQRFNPQDSGWLVFPEATDDEDLLYGLQIIGLSNTATRSWFCAPARYQQFSTGAMLTAPLDPTGKVQGLAHSDLWFQFAQDGGGNSYAVDLTPGPQGTYGQVLFINHEESAGAHWVADSLTQLMVERPWEEAEFEPNTAAELRVKTEHASTVNIGDQLEVLEIRGSGALYDLNDFSGLAGHSNVRTITSTTKNITGLEVLASLPALEYLQLPASLWLQVLEMPQAQEILDRLSAAGFPAEYAIAREERSENSWDLQALVADTLLKHRSLEGTGLVQSQWSLEQPAQSGKSGSWFSRLRGK